MKRLAVIGLVISAIMVTGCDVIMGPFPIGAGVKSTVLDLPPAEDHEGALFYVLDEEVFYYSDGEMTWTMCWARWSCQRGPRLTFPVIESTPSGCTTRPETTKNSSRRTSGARATESEPTWGIGKA